MPTEQLALIIARLVAGAVIAFSAIILWSRTRDTAWMFIIMGIILRYGEIMYTTFSVFGVFQLDPVLYAGVPVLDVVLEVLPFIFFFIALLIMLRRTSFRR